MKNTIIALMAMAGAAFGADYTTETIWTAQFGSAYPNGYTTDLTSAGTFNEANNLKTENGAQTAADARILMAGGTYGDWGSDFELAITLTLTGNSITAGHISELKAGSSGDWLCLGVDTTGALTLSGKKGKFTAGTATGTVTVGEVYDLTLVKLGNKVTLSAGDASVTATLGQYTGTINNITLGGNTGSDKRVPVLVKKMVMSSATIVPEPTTATLSLLALAGLAARRRRK